MILNKGTIGKRNISPPNQLWQIFGMESQQKKNLQPILCHYTAWGGLGIENLCWKPGMCYPWFTKIVLR